MTAIGARVPRHWDDAAGVAHHVHAGLLPAAWNEGARRPSASPMPTPHGWQWAAIESETRRLQRRRDAVQRRQQQRLARIAAGTDRATLRAERAR